MARVNPLTSRWDGARLDGSRRLERTMTDATAPNEDEHDPSEEGEPLTESTDGGLDGGDPGVEE